MYIVKKQAFVNMPKYTCRKHQRRNGPLVPQSSYKQQAALVDNNGQVPALAGIGQSTAFYYAGGQSNPQGCVRAPYDQWYISETDCQKSLPADKQCNPRYINGVWDRYHPWAQDSVSCGGILPPDLLGQTLLTPSLINTQSPLYLQDLSLSLNEGSNVAVLRFGVSDEAGATKAVKVEFKQQNQVQPDLYPPLEYHYAVPYESGIMVLTINTMNGRVTVTFPLGRFPALVQFQMTNIMPWQQNATDLAAGQLG